MEACHIRADGTLVWCSMTMAPLPGMDSSPVTVLIIEQNISERKAHAELAARIQRELVPNTVPEVERYEVAATCMPALDVAPPAAHTSSDSEHNGGQESRCAST
jgi:hypothetical protein